METQFEKINTKLIEVQMKIFNLKLKNSSALDLDQDTRAKLEDLEEQLKEKYQVLNDKMVYWTQLKTKLNSDKNYLEASAAYQKISKNKAKLQMMLKEKSVPPNIKIKIENCLKDIHRLEGVLSQKKKEYSSQKNIWFNDQLKREKYVNSLKKKRKTIPVSYLSEMNVQINSNLQAESILLNGIKKIKKKLVNLNKTKTELLRLNLQTVEENDDNVSIHRRLFKLQNQKYLLEKQLNSQEIILQRIKRELTSNLGDCGQLEQEIKIIYNKYKYHEAVLDHSDLMNQEIKTLEEEEKSLQDSLTILKEEDDLSKMLNELGLDVGSLNSNFGQLDPSQLNLDLN